ncbi:type I restriction enzyme endonuclease domain-containing protein [Mycobacterium camsae]|uniref:type I restriction enzyme endonuclease domain-containing protein n=1 Tax=Mycobacterium gordonae TaxID=1778 RepID=UPI001F120ED3|nr:type I restriction enzyme endonuclease domain-containing protein [Mycobacterium gordonae]
MSHDELAFHDAVAENESAAELPGEDVLAQIAREPVAVMRRDNKTDWTSRDDVGARKCGRRSSDCQSGTGTCRTATGGDQTE